MASLSGSCWTLLHNTLYAVSGLNPEMYTKAVVCDCPVYSICIKILTKVIMVIFLKWNSLVLQCSDVSKNADGMANSVDPDQTAHNFTVTKLSFFHDVIYVIKNVIILFF